MSSNETPTDPWTDAEFEQAVRETAYFLWEQAGRPPGQEKQFWFEGLERCLLRRKSDQELQKAAKSI